MAQAQQRIRIVVAALALLLQAISPVWVAWISLAAGPQSDIVICTGHEDDDGRDQKRAPVHGHLIACPLCMIVSHAFYAPPVSALRISVPTEIVFIRQERFYIAAPRGPPVVEPNARSPPTPL
jgi:Protein of unknown function (DUF2946)